jgi:CBS domain-containing protein
MISKDLISYEISPLMTSDSGLAALSMMEEFKVMHLPIVNSETLLGVISEDDIMAMNEPDAAIGSSELSLKKPYIFDHQHIYDVIKEFNEQELSILPVVDSQMRYQGSINAQHLIKNLAQLTAINQPGGIIILEINQHDYSLGQIAQIVESNDALILSSYVYSNPNTTSIEVTLKINRTDISAIVQTFERYDYTILSTIYESENNDMDERFDSFMKYLNI